MSREKRMMTDILALNADTIPDPDFGQGKFQYMVVVGDKPNDPLTCVGMSDQGLLQAGIVGIVQQLALQGKISGFKYVLGACRWQKDGSITPWLVAGGEVTKLVVNSLRLPRLT